MKEKKMRMFSIELAFTHAESAEKDRFDVLLDFIIRSQKDGIERVYFENHTSYPRMTQDDLDDLSCLMDALTAVADPSPGSVNANDFGCRLYWSDLDYPEMAAVEQGGLTFLFLLGEKAFEHADKKGFGKLDKARKIRSRASMATLARMRAEAKKAAKK